MDVVVEECLEARILEARSPVAEDPEHASIHQHLSDLLEELLAVEEVDGHPNRHDVGLLSAAHIAQVVDGPDSVINVLPPVEPMRRPDHGGRDVDGDHSHTVLSQFERQLTAAASHVDGQRDLGGAVRRILPSVVFH